MYRLRGAPYTSLPEKTDSSLESKMDVIMSGKWTVEDVLEMQVDELSTSGSVGSGVDSPIRSGPYRDSKLEKMRKAYEEYLVRSKKESSIREMAEFLERTVPGIDDGMTGEFFHHLKKEGFQL